METSPVQRGPSVSLAISLLLAALPLFMIYQGGFLGYLEENKTLSDAMVVLPYFLLGISAFLGYKMNQLAIVFSAFAFAMSYATLSPSEGTELVAAKVPALAVVIPMALWLVFMIRPGRLFGTAGLYMLTSTVVPFGAMRLFLRSDPKLATSFFNFHLVNLGLWKLPDISLIFLAGFAFICYRQRDKDLRRYGFSVLFCLLPLFYLLNKLWVGGQIDMRSISLIFTSIGTVCLYAMYQVYWQKIYIDQLTEIPNRRALDEALLKLSRVYSIVMIDIDHFKLFNDNYGHEEGDNVLRFVAFHLSKETGGRAYRYGGEEFCILYNGKDADEVEPMVDAARESLAQRDFYIRAPRDKDQKPKKRVRKEPPPKVKVTISLGIASPSQTNPTPEAVRKAADRALYEAKAQGRNKTVVDLGQEWENASKAI